MWNIENSVGIGKYILKNIDTCSQNCIIGAFTCCCGFILLIKGLGLCKNTASGTESSNNNFCHELAFAVNIHSFQPILSVLGLVISFMFSFNVFNYPLACAIFYQRLNNSFVTLNYLFIFILIIKLKTMIIARCKLENMQTVFIWLFILVLCSSRTN